MLVRGWCDRKILAVGLLLYLRLPNSAAARTTGPSSMAMVASGYLRAAAYAYITTGVYSSRRTPLAFSLRVGEPLTRIDSYIATRSPRVQFVLFLFSMMRWHALSV